MQWVVWPLVLCLSGCGGAENPRGGTGGVSTGGSGDASPAATSTCDSCSTSLDSRWKACCRTDETCGWTTTAGPIPYLDKLRETCHAFAQPGELDPSCPPIEFQVVRGGVKTTFAGCCRPDGRCGNVMHEQSGCVSRDEISSVPARACTSTSMSDR